MSNSILPHWDMTVVYPALDSPEFEKGFQSVVNSITQLAQLFDQHQIAKRDSATIDTATIQTFETIINATNAAIEEMRTLMAYIGSFVSTDTRNNLAQAKQSEFQRHMVQLNHLSTRLTAWIGSLDVEALIEKSTVARDHAFMLRKAKIEAEHQLSPAEEELAAELRPSGSLAWNKLHSNFTSQLLVTIPGDKPQTMPMSMTRNLAFDPDRNVRRQAYLAELEAWRGAAVPLAAAMNSIKGATVVLSKRRQWASPLDVALFDNNIDRSTLDAMMTAAREAFPDFRRYLRAKARALGLPVLAWYDIFAPISGGRSWDYAEGAQFIVEQFGTFSPKLKRMAERAFSENWIDAEPRMGKVDGAFCMSLRKDESRVLTNFKPAFGGVSTVAHELGHAYHNVNLAHRKMLQRQTPMTLAETASIFCETLVTQAALNAPRADAKEQIVILENSLQNACQVVVDISSRFIFESRVYEKRAQRELSIDEFNGLMIDAQHETYGDGLDPDALHPFMWAMKPHYYSSTFYNYPYMFGLLFGLGLYARYEIDPEKFRAGYDDLLSATGLHDAAELGARFGIDTRSPAFWRASFDVIRRDVDRFEALV